MSQIKNIYFLSDGTGITVENLGLSLLNQFHGISYKIIKIPYINNEDKAIEVLNKINKKIEQNTENPIIFSTIRTSKIREVIKSSNAFVLDLFEMYISPLEKELKCKSEHSIGKTHSLSDIKAYDKRMDAINFSLNTDDGVSTLKYRNADVILVGVSRCGKTPTCLYMAIKYGIKAANYPLVDEDLDHKQLPEVLREFKDKLFGLSIDPKRLQAIRNKRRPNSTYSKIQKCTQEVKLAEMIFHDEKIPYIMTTGSSIEEIAAYILEEKKLNFKQIISTEH